MAIKVCQLCAVDFTVEKFLLPLVDGMLGEGWDVNIVCSDGPYIPKMKERGYCIKNIAISRGINPIKSLISIWNLYLLFRKEKYDIIHVHTPVAAFLARISAAFYSKSKIVYTAHGFYFHDEMPKIKWRFFVGLEKIGGFFTDILFCQSSEDAAIAIKENIVKKEKVLVIGNGVDFNKFQLNEYKKFVDSNREKLKIPEGSIVVGIIARMVKEKGYTELLESAINISKRNSKFYLLIIGGRLESDHDVSIDKSLEEARLLMKEKLIEVGFRSDIPELISLMDIFCLPSYREGFPRTVIEAMILGKPVVATDIRGCREAVDNNITGLIVPSRNAVKLEAAIEFLIDNPSIAMKMGQAGMNKALNLYDEQKIINIQIERIKDLLVSDKMR